MKKLVSAENRHALKDGLLGIALFVGAIWLVFFLDLLLPLEALGLVPRSLRGLSGIVAMPFLHGNLSHLTSNTVPLIVTLGLLVGSRSNSVQIVVLISLIGGVLLWLFGRHALHIGASVLVFGLVAFHVLAGFLENRTRSVIIAVAVGVMYAGTFFQGILPFQQGVSWEGHLFGGIAGGLVALGVARQLQQQTGRLSDT